ncbi:MAG: HD domain-containing protein [Spirochaetales bacterium]|nr:HD domain-containing protein [Spirochaetales bacterium]
MSKKFNLDDFIDFLEELDALNDMDEKLSAIITKIKALKGVTEAFIVDFIRNITIPDHLFFIDLNAEYLKDPQSYLTDLIPEKPGIINYTKNTNHFSSAITGTNGHLLCYPVVSKKLGLTSALFIRGMDLERILREYQVELRLCTLKIKELFDFESLEAKSEKQEDFFNLFLDKNRESHEWIAEKGHKSLINWLHLPFYICTVDGKFIFINRSFCKQLNVKSVEDLNYRDSLFLYPKQRKNELALIKKNGHIEGYDLSVRNTDGTIITIRDSAILMGAFILGFFYNITELVTLNQQLQEALGMQEFLNDRLLNSSTLLQRLQNTTIRSLAKLAEYRDGETGNHLNRINGYSSCLMREVYAQQPFEQKITERYMSDFELSAMLHDIGKVGVPDNILLKPENLSAAEYDRMKNHTIWGWAILNQADSEMGEQSYLTMAACIALSHHERYDGKGYPHGLEGEKIPLSARVESIVDVYDALTSRRPYKEAWSHDRAVNEIRLQRNRQFDPVLVDLFLNIENSIYKMRKKFSENR